MSANLSSDFLFFIENLRPICFKMRIAGSRMTISLRASDCTKNHTITRHEEDEQFHCFNHVSFLLHVENESSSKTAFNRIILGCFARLHEKFALPIYPIVVFSYDRQFREATNKYVVEFPDRQVLEFNYNEL